MLSFSVQKSGKTVPLININIVFETKEREYEKGFIKKRI